MPKQEQSQTRLRRPTMQDVARHAGLSSATVSYVLNGRDAGRIPAPTHERILKAAEEIGWRRNKLATGLSTGRVHAIGLVVDNTSWEVGEETNSLYTRNLYVSLTIAAARAGLSLNLLVSSHGTGQQEVDLQDGRLDGAILLGIHHSADWVREVYASGFPCVEIGTQWGSQWVRADDEGGIQISVDHLVQLGHSRIAYFAGPAWSSAARTRERAFCRSVAQSGLANADCPVVPDAGEGVIDGMVEVLRQPAASRPTAIVAFSDWHAVLALDAARACGLRVPEDISLVGFDNDVRARTMRPALTTIVNPLSQIAETAVRRLQRLVNGGDDLNASAGSGESVIETHLVIRASTAPPAVPALSNLGP